MRHQIRIKAILLGIVTGFVAGAVWSIVVAIMLPLQPEQLSNMANTLATNFPLLFLSLAGAFVSSLISGWVSARVAIGSEIFNSLAVGVVILLLSAVLFIPLGMNHYPLLYNIPAFVLTVPFTFLGGLIVVKKRGKK